MAKWLFSNHTANHLSCFSRKYDHNCHVHGKLNSLNGYCCLWRRTQISLSLTESTGWSWLLWMYQTNSTDRIRHHSLKLGLWSPVYKANQLIRNFSDLQHVLIINCLPQTVQAAICHLVCLPDTGWSGGKTLMFQGRFFLGSIDGLICSHCQP